MIARLKSTRWLMGLVALLMVCALYALAAPVTKYNTGTSSSAVTFGATDGRQVVTYVDATSDLAGSVVKFYAKGGEGKVAPTTSPTNGATVIAISNSSYGFTTNDTVVYQHSNGTAVYRTISSATTSNVTLNSGISVAGASGDYLYEITQQGQIYVGMYGTGIGTNDNKTAEGMVFVSPGDSPVYVVLDGTSNTCLQVTIDR